MQKIVSKRVLRKLGDHRPHHAKIVRALRYVWKKFAHWQPALPILLKFPGTRQDFAVVIELRSLHLEEFAGIFAVVFVEHRFGIKRVDLRWSAVHV